MNLEGSFFVRRPRSDVWDLINDPEVLRQAIPGCHSLEAVEDGYAATVAIAIGPVKAKFAGRVQLLDVIARESYRISGAAESPASRRAVPECIWTSGTAARSFDTQSMPTSEAN
jgi:carbon monoxide dehydrogenase subunit G